MFLWVVLQIQTPCLVKTDKDIREALGNLPKGLPETFSRILRQSAKQFGDFYQTRILELVAVAYRPLTTDELREALSVNPKERLGTQAICPTASIQR